MHQLKIKLAKLLYAKSYREGKFTLTSGRESDYYFDCKPTALHPQGAYLIGKILFQLIKNMNPPVQGVGGMTLGADPLVSAVTVVSYLENYPLPGIIVRKKAKGHGTNQFLEGLDNFQRGDQVCVLEDVITTGGSALKACRCIQEAGLKVKAIICILDREEGGRQQIQAQGYELYSVFTREELLTMVKG